MPYFLARDAVLKLLAKPTVYAIPSDELYELDAEGLAFLGACASAQGCAADGKDEFVAFCLGEGILTTECPGDAVRPPLIQSPLPSLRYIELQITDRCNLRCLHCFVGHGGRTDLPLPSILAALDEFQRMQGLRVLLTGGEPLMHPEFAALNERLPEFALRFVLFSNGLLLTPTVMRGLNVHEVQISIDGMREGHEALRGEGTYDRTIAVVRGALDAGIAVSVSTMVHSRNLGEFEGMEQLFRSMGIREWTVDAPCATGALARNGEVTLPPEVAGPYLGYGYGEGFHGGGSEGSACGPHLMALMADGSCARCAFYAHEPVGTLDDGLASCWARVERLTLADLACDCAEKEVCRGGCRFRAEISGGSPGSRRGKDLYKCSLMGYY
jgi:radical SAM protein with 4Fe4S-binding SPASM domain